MLTDEQIDAIANGMPGGLDGFLKGWGWRQFARAVIDASGRDEEALRERHEFVLGMCRDAQEVAARRGWALHTIATLPVPEQDNMVAANMRAVAKGALLNDLLGALAPTAGVEVRSAEQLADGFPRWDEQGRRITDGVGEVPRD